jgi:hypothetical protein
MVRVIISTIQGSMTATNKVLWEEPKDLVIMTVAHPMLALADLTNLPQSVPAKWMQLSHQEKRAASSLPLSITTIMLQTKAIIAKKSRRVLVHPHRFPCITLSSLRTQTRALTSIITQWKRESMEIIRVYCLISQWVLLEQLGEKLQSLVLWDARNLLLEMGTLPMLTHKVLCMFSVVIDISCPSMTYIWSSYLIEYRTRNYCS